MSVLGAFAGGTVFGARSGKEPPNVLVLHGWRKTHADMKQIAEEFNSVSLDLPGFGTSPQPTELWGARQFADAVAPVLDELQKPLIVVGHSFGGRIALQLAAHYPDRIDGIVLSGAPLIRKATTVKTPSLAFRAAKLANRVGLISDSRMEAERKKRGSADYRAASGLMRDIFVKLVNESYETELVTVKCPVELVYGENETEAPVAQAREAASLLSNANFTLVEGGTHWLPVENPEPIRFAVRKLIANAS